MLDNLRIHRKFIAIPLLPLVLRCAGRISTHLANMAWRR